MSIDGAGGSFAIWGDDGETEAALSSWGIWPEYEPSLVQFAATNLPAVEVGLNF